VAQLIGAAGALAEPEWNGRRLALGVLDVDLACLDLGDAVGSVAKLEDVAGDALEGEVLVERTDAMAFRHQHHLVIELVWNHAGIGDGGELGAAARAQHAVDRVVMQIGAAPATAGGVAIGQHLHHLFELGQAEFAVRRRAAQAAIQLVQVPVLATDLGHEMLRQHVERLVRHMDAVQLAAPHRVEQGGAFQ